MKETDYISKCCKAPVVLDTGNLNWKIFICTACRTSGNSLSVEDFLKEAKKK